MLTHRSRCLLVSVLLAASGLAACHRKGKVDSGGGNAPSTSPNSPAPAPAATYNVYDDAGGVLGDPNALLFTGGGLTVAEQSGGAPEGSKYMRASNAVPGSFWGVTLDRNNKGNSKDLSSFSGGKLTFQIRVDRALGIAERLLVNVTDSAGKTQSIQISDAEGFDINKPNVWQAISIPLSGYAVDKTKIKVPFAIAVDSPAGTPALTIDIDIVQWVA